MKHAKKLTPKKLPKNQLALFEQPQTLGLPIFTATPIPVKESAFCPRPVAKREPLPGIDPRPVF